MLCCDLNALCLSTCKAACSALRKVSTYFKLAAFYETQCIFLSRLKPFHFTVQNSWLPNETPRRYLYAPCDTSNIQHAALRCTALRGSDKDHSTVRARFCSEVSTARASSMPSANLGKSGSSVNGTLMPSNAIMAVSEACPAECSPTGTLLYL